MRITHVMLAFLAILPSAAFAQFAEEVWYDLGLIDPLVPIAWASVVSGFFILASVYYRKHMGEHAKKIAFVAIAIPIIIATAYLSGSTVYLNLRSATGGPIHWHADYEVWACGVQHDLVDPTGLENRVGPPLLHEHNDNRIHVEGVPLHLEDVTLGQFFRAVGGSFDSEGLSFPTNQGVKTWKNGDLCNGSPAKWYTFVDGVLTENGYNHVYAPYSTVPPGNFIKIVFSEKQPGSINTKIFEVP